MRIPVAALAFASLALVSPFALAAPPVVGGCPVLPANNYWNTPIDTLPVHAYSNAWVSTIGSGGLHADWGNVLSDNYGIPFTTVTGAQPLVPIDPDPVDDFSDESDPGPYPIPPDAPIEGGPASDGDRHVLVLETTNCVLYELYNARPVGGGSSWTASSFAKFNLNANAPLRPAGWTSADAAGLPIFPGLVRYEEALTGEITHAIRFTAAQIWGREAGLQKYLWPARHQSGSNTSPSRPPMGARFRLKASYNIPSSFHPLTQTILRAFKKYGMVLADGGSNWFFQGVSNESWPDDIFSQLGSVSGSNFEAVDTAMLQVDVNSGEAKQTVVVDTPRMTGISTRMQVLTGDNVLIGGFIIQGAAPKTVVIRARGPSLGVAGALADPTLTLVPASGPAIANDDWQSAANQAVLFASGYAPASVKESALMVTLDPGAYTAIVGGVGNTTGVAIVEVYEMDRPDIPATGISTRGLVQTGDNVMIGGFIIQGSGPQTVVVRARGPSLGVAGSLQNPTLTLVPAAGPTVTNDDWQTAANAAQLSASGFAPTDARESAILVTLDPGAYTAIVSGVGGTTGVAIVEVYAQ